MGSRKLLFYLLALALVFFVLRPRRSWENLREMYTYRRWLLAVISTLLLVYIAFGIYQIWKAGLWWW